MAGQQVTNQKYNQMAGRTAEESSWEQTFAYQQLLAVRRCGDLALGAAA